MNDNYKEIKFDVEGKEHTAIISYYTNNGNRAVATYDESKFPHCTVSTNPISQLDSNIIAVRDDYVSDIFWKELEALVASRIIEKVEPEQQIPMGYVTATLYKVLLDGEDENDTRTD